MLLWPLFLTKMIFQLVKRPQDAYQTINEGIEIWSRSRLQGIERRGKEIRKGMGGCSIKDEGIGRVGTGKKGRELRKGGC